MSSDFHPGNPGLIPQDTFIFFDRDPGAVLVMAFCFLLSSVNLGNSQCHTGIFRFPVPHWDFLDSQYSTGISSAFCFQFCCSFTCNFLITTPFNFCPSISFLSFYFVFIRLSFSFVLPQLYHPVTTCYHPVIPGRGQITTSVVLVLIREQN